MLLCVVSNYKRMNKDSSNAEVAFKVTIQSTFLMMIYSTRNWSQVHTRTLSTGESVWRWLKFEERVIKGEGWSRKGWSKAATDAKRFQAVAYAHTPTGNLPRDRTEGSTQVIGVDYVGPIKYRTRGRKEGKAYIVLFACSLTRGLYLELLPELTTDEFLGSLKRLIARRGKLKQIYSDFGKTFIAAAK